MSIASAFRHATPKEGVPRSRAARGRPAVLLTVVSLLWLAAAPPAAATNHAFITNVGANVNITQLAGNQAEGTIAVNPTNPQQLFYASNPGTVGFRSVDGGQNWIAANPGFTGAQAPCCDNVATWDAFGNLFLVYLSLGADGAIGGTPPSADQTIELALSTDGGQNFNIIQQIDGPARVDQPSVAVGAGSVWVTWNRGNIIGARGAQVTGLGAVGAFTAIQTAAESGGGAGQFGDISVGPGGEVVVSYQSDTQIRVNTDADGLGAGGFAAAVVASNTNVARFDSVPPQDNRTIDAEANLEYDRSGGANNGRLYLVYTNETPDESNDTDIFVRRSDDDGANWSAPVRVNDDAGTNAQILPEMAVDQTTGFIGVSWHDARNDVVNNNTTQFFGAFSTDGGVTFRPNVQISAGTSNEDTAGGVVEYGDYTGAAFVAQDYYPVWSDNSNSTGDNPAGANSTFDMYTSRVHFEFNDPPVVDAGPNVSGDEGSAIALDATVTQNDEAGFDPLTTTWTVGVGDPCTFAHASAIDTTITCTDNGTFTATLTAQDSDNPAVSDSTTVTVANVPPSLTITAPLPGDLFQIGTAVNLTAPFTDPGADTWSCSIDWDDGNVTTPAPTGMSCDESHLYAAAGVYTIQVTVSDDDGGSDTESVMVVVFDPSAGFVTGGGWIDSPAGAYLPDPSLTGKATFGFVSKYQKGAVIPIGQTEFQFQVAGFTFHSSSYQWLVVTGGGKAQYKGTGTVNGVAGYGFLLTATEGAIAGGPDKFRIKIWEIATDTLVYDNVAAAGDDIDVADPQAIAHGNIVIHRK
jgi:hypothetical protein